MVSMYVCDYKVVFLQFHTPSVFQRKMENSMQIVKIDWENYEKVVVLV